MKKILVSITLLTASAGVVATPALARDRDDFNRRDTRVEYRAPVVETRGRNDRGRDYDRYRRVDHRYDNCR